MCYFVCAIGVMCKDDIKEMLEAWGYMLVFSLQKFANCFEYRKHIIANYFSCLHKEKPLSLRCYNNKK